MTTREQVAHLLRRYGLGASRSELDACEKLGVKGTLARLLDYDSIDEGFPVSPWEFCFQTNGQVQTDPARIARWWALRLLMTKRPLQEKLTLFWHDHFAVSGSKVESGPMLLVYLDALRAHAGGRFRTLLGAVTKDPAMLRWLDNDLSVKGSPNENYARELMELFTIGIGNYTEKDVQESARALTGWSLRSAIQGGNQATAKARLMAAVEKGVPLIASSYSEGYHDEGVKTILGKSAPFDTETLLDLLADKPETAKALATKLWEFFAYPNPEPSVVERTAKVFRSSKGDIKAVLASIANSKEFWSERCVRGQVKSPVDFTVAVIRQLELGDRVLQGREANADWTTPIPQYTNGVAEIVLGTMRRQGMTLLYPPDVAGWNWGTAWVSPAMMVERERLATALLGPGRGQGTAAILVARAKEAGATSAEGVVDVLIDLFDAPCRPEQRSVLVEAFEKGGGMAVLGNVQKASNALAPVVRLMFSAPEFHFC
ncbi:MAG: DUF1800 domain-containing protein [Fimbriimonadaceae bacterium]|nr:DUF1800 domain-containing protein [Chthonomonadaceae bacterium]MCO5297842.1 DUF1800 domain-containing protein [Fimbriimonadaceae bacterium]